MTRLNFIREASPVDIARAMVNPHRVQSVYTPSLPRPAPALVTCRYCSSRVEDGARCSHCGATDQWRKP
jgi:hypothetical protein